MGLFNRQPQKQVEVSTEERQQLRDRYTNTYPLIVEKVNRCLADRGWALKSAHCEEVVRVYLNHKDFNYAAEYAVCNYLVEQK